MVLESLYGIPALTEVHRISSMQPKHSSILIIPSPDTFILKTISLILKHINQRGWITHCITLVKQEAPSELNLTSEM